MPQSMPAGRSRICRPPGLTSPTRPTALETPRPQTPLIQQTPSCRTSTSRSAAASGTRCGRPRRRHRGNARATPDDASSGPSALRGRCPTVARRAPRTAGSHRSVGDAAGGRCSSLSAVPGAVACGARAAACGRDGAARPGAPPTARLRLVADGAGVDVRAVPAAARRIRRRGAGPDASASGRRAWSCGARRGRHSHQSPRACAVVAGPTSGGADEAAPRRHRLPPICGSQVCGAPNLKTSL